MVFKGKRTSNINDTYIKIFIWEKKKKLNCAIGLGRRKEDKNQMGLAIAQRWGRGCWVGYFAGSRLSSQIKIQPCSESFFQLRYTVMRTFPNLLRVSLHVKEVHFRARRCDRARESTAQQGTFLRFFPPLCIASNMRTKRGAAHCCPHVLRYSAWTHSRLPRVWAKRLQDTLTALRHYLRDKNDARKRTASFGTPRTLHAASRTRWGRAPNHRSPSRPAAHWERHPSPVQLAPRAAGRGGPPCALTWEEEAAPGRRRQ